MHKILKRASVSLFTMMALILLSALMSQAWGRDVRDVRSDDIGMSVEAEHGNGEIVGRVVDVDNNGDVTIGLREDDRKVTVSGVRVHVDRDRVIYEGIEDELYRMASRDRRYDDRDRGYYNGRDYNRDRDRDYYNERNDRDRDHNRGEESDNFSLKDLFGIGKE